MAGYVMNGTLFPEEIATIDDPYGTEPAIVKAVHDVGNYGSFYVLVRTYKGVRDEDEKRWFDSDEEAIEHFRERVSDYWRAQMFYYLAGIRTGYDFDEIWEALYGPLDDETREAIYG